MKHQVTVAGEWAWLHELRIKLKVDIQKQAQAQHPLYPHPQENAHLTFNCHPEPNTHLHFIHFKF